MTRSSRSLTGLVPVGTSLSVPTGTASDKGRCLCQLAQAVSYCVVVATATTNEASQTRERLLDAILEYVTAHGIGELGFRELARAIGTSHRMLGYHFGSKEGLLVAIVRAVEERQREAMAELAADDSLDPVEQMRRMGERL